MNKFIALLKKDIILQIRNLRELFIAIGLAIVIIILFSFSENGDLIIGVEEGLEEQIGFNYSSEGISVPYLGENILIKTQFYNEQQLIYELENNNYPIIIYEDNNQMVVKMNSNDSRAITLYLLLSRYFNGIENDPFEVEFISSSDNVLIMLIISFAFIFGGASRGSNVIFSEKKNGTLNILYKSGLSSFSIVFEKLIFTVLVMSFIFLAIGIFGVLTDYVNLFINFRNIVFLIFIMIPIAALGNFIGIISKSIEESRSYQVLLFIPSMFYIAIVNNIPKDYQVLLQIHPGIAVTNFYEKVINGNFDATLFIIIILITILVFSINVLMLRRTSLKLK